MPVSQKAYQWIASLYFFQSIPFVVVSLIATMMYQQQGMDNSQSALLTSLLVIPWAIKPLFAPSLEKFSTKKRLTVLTEGLIAALFLLLALSADNSYFISISTCGFLCLALSSSIHDIVSDGVYLLNLDEENQKRYVALRSFFYQLGRLVIKGGLLAVVGQLAIHYKVNAWQVFFAVVFAITFLLMLYHSLKIPEVETRSTRFNREYFSIFKTLMTSRQVYLPLIFIFLYNFTDAQMQKVVPLFLLDKLGLDLSLARVGEIYGISGSLALMLGIFISGFLLSRFSLAACLKRFTILLLSGHFFFFLLALHRPSLYAIYVTILFSQFAFGLANGAYMGYLLSVANKSAYPMSMYTVCTATMALSYVFFGAFSGWIEQVLGYSYFFFYIFLANSMLVLLTYWMMHRHG
ncbi:muropeptide transporter [Legionella massiliensis]|uniref:Muropeptide transporter n=1 Tax=Legionella massiliensis TaxID=1034943 RepID=A0A078KQ96_9GAMM|nr:MFS transporter [Legionella massiliensis]CDZ76550.1 muropeptide transporter [Legionella massiliensis]CEE12288.1 muropeptide transporter [Legionella massiliensis]